MITTILFVLLAVWLIRAMIDVAVGILQIFLGLLSALIGAVILVTIFLVDGLVLIIRIACEKTG